MPALRDHTPQIDAVDPDGVPLKVAVGGGHSADSIVCVVVGDALLEIDGLAASKLTPIQVRDLLSVDGATRRLLLERDGGTATKEGDR